MTSNIVNEEEAVAIVPVKKENVEKQEQPKALDSIYDHYQKKLYVIDRSGSMSSGMAPEDEILMYTWSDDILKKFRDEIEKETDVEVQIGTMTIDEAKEFFANDIGDERKLIQFILANDLMFKYGIDVPVNYEYARNTERKIEAVRGAMRKFVEQRFQKYPDAQVGVFGFGDKVELMAYAGNDKDIVLRAIAALASDMGGTDICAAVKRAMSEMKARPSRVGAHHIVLVTDAQDYGAIGVAEMLPEMKCMNVVFDFILVIGQYDGYTRRNGEDEEPVKTLKRVCSETGGEYNEVRKSSDFEQKFLKVSNRPALPPKRD